MCRRVPSRPFVSRVGCIPTQLDPTYNPTQPQPGVGKSHTIDAVVKSLSELGTQVGVKKLLALKEAPRGCLLECLGCSSTSLFAFT